MGPRRIPEQAESGRATSYDVKMQSGGSLKEVTVGSGPRKVRAVTHSTEQQLVQEIKGATGVVSGISSELISKTADRNAAEIVKRISGVTVVDDRFIVVRGMNERYNLTYLNSNLAPSTELFNKAFAYDLLPSSIIDKILVYKSPVADLVADYAGAAIRVYTKNAMPVKHFDIGVQLAARDGSNFTNINSYTGGKYDFLGFDDGSRKLPKFSPGVFESNRRVHGVSNEDYLKGFNTTLSPGKRYSLPDLQLFVNYYNSWKLGRARLYDLTSITYTKETTAFDIYRQRGNTNAEYVTLTDGGQAYGDKNRITNSQQTTETGKINVLENLTLKLNDRNSISFRNFYVNDGKRQTNIDNSRPNALPEYYLNDIFKQDYFLSFQQRMLYSGNLNGVHQLKDERQQLAWNIGYTHDLQSIPDMRISHFGKRYPITVDSVAWLSLGSNGGADDIHSGMISRLFIRNLEQVYNASVDYTFHLTPSFTLKAGGYELFKTRQVGRRFFRVNRAGLSTDEYYGPNGDLNWNTGYGYTNLPLVQFRPEDLSKVWSTHYFPADGTGLAIYDATSPTDAYTASEQYNAFYLMGDWKAGRHFTFNVGVRGEFDRQRLSGAKPGAEGGSSVEEVNIDKKKTIILPSFNASYQPDSTIVIRGSYGRTVNRPDFRELTPYGDFDFQNNEQITGNAHVVTAVIDNYDIRAELYPRNNRSEMFNIGAFYKYLDHPIEKMRQEVTSSTVADVFSFTNITFDNSVSGRLWGLEAEVKKSLSFIPGNFFRHLSFVFNGSLIKSETVRRKSNNDYATDTLHKPGGPLQGQSPYILNTGIFYENVASGTKIGLVYNVNGPRIYAKSVRTPSDTSTTDVYNRPDLLQLPMHLLDLSITQRLVKSLQVKISIQNLLNQEYRIIEDHNYNQRYDKEYPLIGSGNKTYFAGDNIYTKYKPGRYLLLQFTYAF